MPGGSSLGTAFPVSGNVPDNALLGVLTEKFVNDNPHKNISVLSRAIGGARFADVAAEVNVIPASSDWVDFRTVTATASVNATTISVNSTEGIARGWYGKGAGMSANSRVVSVDVGASTVTLNLGVTEALNAASIDFVRPWLETVFAEAPTVAALSLGMNDGDADG